MLEKPIYLMLPMLLQEGRQVHCHPVNPTQHMENTPMLVAVTPTIGRSHHCTHSEPIHYRPGGGIFLPTYLVSVDGEINMVEVLQG